MNTTEPQHPDLSEAAKPADSPPPADAPVTVGAGINFTDPNSPLAFAYLRASHLVAISFLALVFLYFGVFTPLAHSDIWGHMKYGEWIVANHALPEYEPFCEFADRSQPVGQFQWLSQVIFYLAFHAGAVLAGGDDLRQTAGGVEMLRTLYGVLVILKIGLVMAAIRRSTRSMPLAIVGAVFFFLLTMGNIRVQRPQIFGEIFFAFLVWWVSAPRLSALTGLVVPLVLAVWANCHGSFVVGMMFVGLFWSGRVVELLWKERLTRSFLTSPDLRNGLAAVVAAPIAIGILNPHGFAIYSMVFALTRNPNIHTMGEWSPLDFSQVESGGHWLYLATLVILAISQLASPRPLPVARLFVLFPFAIGPLSQQRMMAWWLILVPWFATLLWQHALVHLPKRWLQNRTEASLRKTFVGAFIIVCAFIWSGLFQLLAGKDPLPLATTTTHATMWPLAMELKHGKGMPELHEALKHYPNQRFQGRMLLQENMADFLVWSLPEKPPVLVYSHAHVFPEYFWREYLHAMAGGPGWDSMLNRYRVNLLVVDPDAWNGLAEKLRHDPNWDVLLDEGQGSQSTLPPTVGNVKLFIVIRKHPI
ncbi:MAG TPA: hypothetical protein VFE62_15690 [Gemmataceae bacterium]|nr:hypothetical protein [Gemmataceae bacterium]